MGKIALIQCPVWGTYDPPIVLAQLAGCLKKAGQEVFVFDLNIKLYQSRNDNYKDMWAWEQCSFWYNAESVNNFFIYNKAAIDRHINEIIETGVKVFGFSVNAASRLASLKVAKIIKNIKKDAIVIFGGPLFFENRFVESVLNEGVTDYVIAGEAEAILEDFIQALQVGGNIFSCKEIHSKAGGKIVSTGIVPLVSLDSLPFLDFSELPLSNYDDNRHIPFMTSRGCVQRCVFCSSRAFWPGYRVMSGERIFKEIKFHMEQLRKTNPDLSHVDFLDLVFNGNMKSLVGFCDAVIKSKLNFFWTANMIIRPEMASRVIAKLKKSGCEHIIFGIESGSQRVLNLMNKHYRIEDADRIIKDLHKVGIKVTANFMFGFPGETEEDFQQTLDFIKRNAKFLDRVYPSRTYCAIEEFSYLSQHPEEFDIKQNLSNHLYWETKDGKNTYPERLRRCEEFCALASSLGIEVGCGVQTSVELDRYFNLGHYYESKGDLKGAMDCFLRYRKLDPNNEVIRNKVNYYLNQKQLSGNEGIGVAK
jgi:radical SAM superfamily enzyme YgiQ (UPF0313 family)